MPQEPSMKSLLLVVPAFVIAISQGALAQTVNHNCAVPPSAPRPNGKVFYVDPVNGSMSGNGSRANPWHTFSEVVANGLISTTPSHWDPFSQQTVPANPSAPIHPGDTVYLLSGNHGPVSIRGSFGAGLVGFNNSDFITVAALPGLPPTQPPVISQLSINGAGKWVFSGLTFQSQNTTGTYTNFANGAPDYFLVSLLGPHNDIVLIGDTLMSTPDASNWTIANWQMQRASGVHDYGGTCITLVNNNLMNVGFGMVSQLSNNVLISNNTINYFTDDAIDYGSNNMLIQNNTITNSVEDGDGFHRDGMQGQPYTSQSVVSNIVIQNNVIIRISDPNIQFPGYLQGIDVFDGVYKNVTVSGNTIVTDIWNGIAYYGVSSLKVYNNIVLSDGDRVLPCRDMELASCQAQSIIYDMSALPGINITASKTGVPSAGVSVYNNIVTGVGITPDTTGLTFKNNLCVPLLKTTCIMGYPVSGVMVWTNKPASYADTSGRLTNVVAGVTPYQLFDFYDPVGMNYDFNLAVPNPALPNG
jgi:hypothetical protein